MQEEITTEEQEIKDVEVTEDSSAAVNVEKLEDGFKETEKKSHRRKTKKTEAAILTNEAVKTEIKNPIQIGDMFETRFMLLYRSSAAPKYCKGIRGRFYIWDDVVVDGRVRITDSKSGIGNLRKMLGWVNLTDIVK